MKFAIAVILYNPDQKALDKLYKYSEITDVLVFDNSENYEVDHDIKSISKLYTHDYNGNVGMTGALKTIFDYGRDRYDYILTMDQDTEFSNESIHQMIEYVKQDEERSSVGIYCPNNRKIYNGKTGEVFGKMHIPESKIKDVHFSMTSCSFVNCKVLKKVEMSNLFIGYVDNELCYEVINQNLKIKMLGFVCMNQRVGTTVTANMYNTKLHVNRLSKVRYYYMVRNNFFLQKKYANNTVFKKELRINLVRVILNILIGEKNKIDRLSYALKGYKSFRTGIMGKINDENKG